MECAPLSKAEIAAPWVQLLDGSAFLLSATRRADAYFSIELIAASLAKLNRYSGHTREPWSVAQHSVLVADVLALNGDSPRVQLWGLLHDAHEAVLGDITTPVRRALGIVERVAQLERAVDIAIYSDLGLQPPSQFVAVQVRNADLIAMATERRDLLAPCAFSWGAAIEAIAPAPITCEPVEPRFAEMEFLGRYYELTRELAAVTVS